MSLEDDLEALMTVSHVPPRVCAVTHALESLTDKQVVAVNTLIDHSTVPAARISTVLISHGLKVSDKSISRHRRRMHGGGCACPM